MSYSIRVSDAVYDALMKRKKIRVRCKTPSGLYRSKARYLSMSAVIERLLWIDIDD